MAKDQIGRRMGWPEIGLGRMAPDLLVTWECCMLRNSSSAFSSNIRDLVYYTMPKRVALFILITSVVLAQKPKAVAAKQETMDSCGLGRHKDHPCHCVEHTEKVRNEMIQQCRAGNSNDKELAACLRAIPDHCTLIERYGNWAHEGDPMPGQCTMACKRGHCDCDDGPRCHIGHEPQDDSASAKE